jgi:hypothetical protein
MSRQKPIDEIEALRKQREQIGVRLKEASARRKVKERRDEQRRKTIAGTLALEYVAANPQSEFASVFAELLTERLSRVQDRALFTALLHPVQLENGKIEDGQMIQAATYEEPAAPLEPAPGQAAS